MSTPDEVIAARVALGQQLAAYRRAAGHTQHAFAPLTHYGRSSVANVEAGRQNAPRAFWERCDELLRASGALIASYDRVDLLVRQRRRQAAETAVSFPTNVIFPADSGLTTTLRRAVLGLSVNAASVSECGSTPCTQQPEAGVIQAHRLYQLAEYDAAVRLLSVVLNQMEVSVPGAAVPSALKAAAYLAGAKLAVKLGDAGLAWVTADRCLRFATEAARPSLVGIASYQVACALLAAGHLAAAEQTVAGAAEQVACAHPQRRGRPDDTVSVHGSLRLLLAVLAARRGDSLMAQANLRHAGQLAERLGRDDNRLWTAFGPTNVAIHELSVRVALGDAAHAFRLGEVLNVDALPPVLLGRRSHVHLELAWAAVHQSDDSLAVLHLLEAERVANQAVSMNIAARELLSTLLARERKSTTPGLRALAGRAGVLQ